MNLGLMKKYEVSIHAPREGCDISYYTAELINARFNSRTPGGVRQYSISSLRTSILFQFTHPGRGATLRT